VSLGQFAKPRSTDTETIDGVELPSYRGDNVNGDAFTAAARTPDPSRLIRSYNQSAATLNLLRGFSMGGYASLERIQEWNLDFVKEDSEQGKKFLDLAHQLDEAILFMVRVASYPAYCLLSIRIFPVYQFRFSVNRKPRVNHACGDP
jgi:3-deoxy-7-phosphoheptulonate synthase